MRSPFKGVNAGALTSFSFHADTGAMDLVLLGTTGTVLGRKTMHLPGAALVGAITVDYNTCVRRCGWRLHQHHRFTFRVRCGCRYRVVTSKDASGAVVAVTIDSTSLGTV